MNADLSVEQDQAGHILPALQLLQPLLGQGARGGGQGCQHATQLGQLPGLLHQQLPTAFISFHQAKTSPNKIIAPLISTISFKCFYLVWHVTVELPDTLQIHFPHITSQ